MSHAPGREPGSVERPVRQCAAAGSDPPEPIDPSTFEVPCETLFEEAPCFITVQDRHFNMLQANRLFRETFGFEQGMKCYELFRKNTTACQGCPVERSFADGESHRSEESVRTPDGRDLTVIVQTTPLRDDNGNITSVMEMATDITHNKALQKKLNSSRKLLRTLFEEVPCYMTVQDRDFRLLDANRRFREDFGVLSGDRCYELYKHRDEPCFRCPVAETFADGKTHTSEEIVFTLDGTKRNVLVQTAPIRDAEGEIQSVLEISTDISEIRQLQDQLTNLGLLVGSTSHGIKGLLTGLDGGVYVLDSGFERDDMDRIKQGWEMIKRNVDRIRSMVLDMLYYAKDRDTVMVPIEPHTLISDIHSSQATKAAALGIDLVLEVEQDARPFEADLVGLRSLLVNLVENSMDACRLDKVKSEHRVTVRNGGDDEHVVFEVRDNGIGMDRETREKVFTLFFSSKGMEGTGLGLFIANRIARQHGGSIDVDSEPGRGTTFRVILPRRRPTGESREVEAS